jgi:streptomycin 3"-adenylyltransferase
MQPRPSEEIPPPEVVRFCESLIDPMAEVLSDRLLAVYLYGSAATGDFQPASSDIDLLILVDGRIDDSIKSELIRLLWDRAADVPGKGMETWVLTSEVASAAGRLRDYELMVSTHPQEPLTLDGANHPGEAPIVDLALVRDTGIAFHGQPPPDLIVDIPREVVIREMVRKHREESSEASEAYLVLNVTRSVAFAETGIHMSKLEGARWYQGQADPSPVVERAVKAATGLAPEGPLTPGGKRFMEEMYRRLEAEARPTS